MEDLKKIKIVNIEFLLLMQVLGDAEGFAEQMKKLRDFELSRELAEQHAAMTGHDVDIPKLDIDNLGGTGQYLYLDYSRYQSFNDKSWMYWLGLISGTILEDYLFSCLSICHKLFMHCPTF